MKKTLLTRLLPLLACAVIGLFFISTANAATDPSAGTIQSTIAGIRADSSARGSSGDGISPASHDHGKATGNNILNQPAASLVEADKSAIVAKGQDYSYLPKNP